MAGAKRSSRAPAAGPHHHHRHHHTHLFLRAPAGWRAWTPRRSWPAPTGSSSASARCPAWRRASRAWRCVARLVLCCCWLCQTVARCSACGCCGAGGKEQRSSAAFLARYQPTSCLPSLPSCVPALHRTTAPRCPQAERDAIAIEQEGKVKEYLALRCAAMQGGGWLRCREALRGRGLLAASLLSPLRAWRRTPRRCRTAATH